jgi:KUP system potassium uptake protein
VHDLEHNQVMHEQAELMSVRTRDIPYGPKEQRVEVAGLGAGFFRVIVSYGFMNHPDVPPRRWSSA